MEGGTAWFTDLTVSDTTMVLPFMAFGVFLLSAELGGADGMQGQPPHVIQRFKWAMRILTAVMIPFAKDLPAVRSHFPVDVIIAIFKSGGMTEPGHVLLELIYCANVVDCLFVQLHLHVLDLTMGCRSMIYAVFSEAQSNGCCCTRHCCLLPK